MVKSGTGCEAAVRLPLLWRPHKKPHASSEGGSGRTPPDRSPELGGGGARLFSWKPCRWVRAWEPPLPLPTLSHPSLSPAGSPLPLRPLAEQMRMGVGENLLFKHLSELMKTEKKLLPLKVHKSWVQSAWQ